MRRKDREITEIKKILDILDRCEVLHLAMSEKDIPYVVPLNFGWQYEKEKLSIYFHCAKEGRKINIFKANPKVCFEGECFHQVITNEKPCNWTEKYESVIGSGKVMFLDDYEEKISGLTTILKKNGYQGEAVYDEKIVEMTCVCRIDVEEVTGKKNLL